MDSIISIVIFVSGLIIGVIICRYGIGLGNKLTYRAKEDLPLSGEGDVPIEQEATDEVEEEEE